MFSLKFFYKSFEIAETVERVSFIASLKMYEGLVPLLEETPCFVIFMNIATATSGESYNTHARAPKMVKC